MIILRCTNQDGTKVDLDVLQGEDIKVDISAIESGEIGEVFGVSSQGFALPATPKNQAFFGYLDDLGATPATGFTKTIPCQVLNNGDEVFSGKLYVQDVITNQKGDTIYEVVVVNETVDFSIAIKNLTVQDLDWSEYDHAYSYTNVSASWNDALFGGDIVYPLIDYGTDNDDPTATTISAGGGVRQFDNDAYPLLVEDFKPAIKAKAVVDKIFESVGFSYTSSFMEDAYFNNLYILSTQDDKKGTTFVTPTSQSFQANLISPVQIVSGSSIADQILFPNEVFDNASNYNTGTSKFRAGEDGVYTFYSQLLFTEFNISASDVRFIVPQIFVNGVSQADTFINLKNLTPGVQRTGYIGPVGLNLTAGDIVDIRLSYEVEGGGTQYLTVNRNSRFEGVGPSAVQGGTVKMSKIFDPKTKVEDILKGLIQKFNLVIEPVVDSRNILSIQTFNDWVDQGTVVNWTDIVDRDTKFKIEHPLQTQPKKLYFSDVEDTDALNVYTKETFDKTFGEYLYESDSDLAEGERKIGTYFAPTPIKGIDGAPTMLVPRLSKKIPNQRNEPFKFKPRLLYKVGMTDTSLALKGVKASAADSGSYYFISDGANTYAHNEYMLFHHLNEVPASFTGSLDLNFGNLNQWSYHQNEYNARTKNSAFQTYWAQYVNEIYDIDARLLTCNIMLDPVDIPSIKLNDKIFIDGHYYRINKISGANLQNKASVQVQLLKTAPRKLPWPRRRIINKYTGDWVRDVYVDDILVNGDVVYADFSNGVIVSGSDVDKAAPLDGFISYDGNAIWNNDKNVGASFVTQEVLGSNDLERSADQIAVKGNFNEIKANTFNVSVVGNDNLVSEESSFIAVDGVRNTVERQVVNASMVNASDSLIGKESTDISFVNTIQTQVTASNNVAILSDIQSRINNGSSNGTTTLIGTRATTVSGSINDLTLIGCENIQVTGGNYHVVIGKDDEIDGALDLNRYRFNTNVLNDTYLDDGIYLNRDSYSILAENTTYTYLYSGEPLYKYAFDITWGNRSGSGTHYIELPGISSQDQYGRTVLFKCDDTISPTSSVEISVVGGADTIDGQSTYTLDNPYAWVELRASNFLSGEGYINDWRVINSSERDSRQVYDGNFYHSGSQALSDIVSSQIVQLNQTREANGMYLSSNRIYLSHPGTYKLEVYARISNNDTAPQDAYMWLKYNGTDWPFSTVQTTIPARKSAGNPSVQIISIAYIGTSISPTDYVELYWGGQSTNLSLQGYAAGASPTRPAAPSVSIIITPVG